MSLEFITSLILFWLRGKVGVEKNFLRVTFPNTLFKIIPLGTTNRSIPVNQISNVEDSFRVDAKTLLWGIVFVIFGYYWLGDTDTLLFGILVLIYGIITIISSLETLVVIQATSGAAIIIPLVIFEKAKAQQIKVEIEKITNYHNESHDLNIHRREQMNEFREIFNQSPYAQGNQQGFNNNGAQFNNGGQQFDQFGNPVNNGGQHQNNGGQFDQFNNGGQFDQFNNGGQFDQFNNGGQHQNNGGQQFDQFNNGGQFDQFNNGGQFDQFNNGGQFDQFNNGGQFDQFNNGGQFDQFNNGGQFDQFNNGGQFDQFGNPVNNGGQHQNNGGQFNNYQQPPQNNKQNKFAKRSDRLKKQNKR